MADVVYFDGGIDLPFCPPTVNGIYISGSGCCSEFYSAFIGGNQTYNLTYTLPTASGTSGQVLTNDGNGNLSWTTVSGGGGGTVSGNYVPYLGATGNTDLGGYGIAGSYFQLSTSTGGTLVPGMFSWNGTEGTADLMLKGGNVTLQIGQEQVARVINETGANLLESQYKVVRVNGSTGTRLKVALALASGDATSVETLGVVTENITLNQEGFVTTSGLVRGINTTGSLQGETWSDGDMLFLSPFVAGGLTNIKPQAPNHLVVMGYVVTAANNGTIYVKVDNGYELDELHNVLISSAATNEILAYDGVTGVWRNRTTSSLNIASGSGTATQLAFWGGATGTTSNTLTSSTGLTWDNTNRRLGVGITSPIATLHVDGTVAVGVTSVGGGARMRVAQGISTVDFLVENSIYFPGRDLLMWSTTASGDSGNAYTFADINTGTLYKQIKCSSVRISSSASGSLGSLITSLGNAYFSNSTSIGTTVSSARLHVVGSGNTSTSTSFLVQNSSSNNMFSVLDNGNIGINTNNPQQTLHIEGTMRLTGSTGDSTTIMGRNASGDVSAISIGSGLSLSGNTLSSTGGGGGSGTVTGSGTATQVAFWGGISGSTSTALTSSTGLTWDESSKILLVNDSVTTNNIRAVSLSTTRFTLTSTAIEAYINNGNGFRLSQPGLYVGPSTGSGAGARLHVQGAGSSSTSSALVVYNSSSSELFKIRNDGVISINNSTPTASSILDITSTTLGFLPPRMSTTQKTGIASPAQGLVVYDTTMQALSAYNGSNWATVGGGEQTFTITGSTATINFNAGNIADITLATSTTLTLTGGTFGTFIIKLTQDATGGRVVSWPSNVRWSGGIPPSLTTTGGKVDVISLIFDGTNYYGTYALNF